MTKAKQKSYAQHKPFAKGFLIVTLFAFTIIAYETQSRIRSTGSTNVLRKLRVLEDKTENDQSTPVIEVSEGEDADNNGNNYTSEPSESDCAIGIVLYSCDSVDLEVEDTCGNVCVCSKENVEFAKCIACESVGQPLTDVEGNELCKCTQALIDNAQKIERMIDAIDDDGGDDCDDSSDDLGADYDGDAVDDDGDDVSDDGGVYDSDDYDGDDYDGDAVDDADDDAIDDGDNYGDDGDNYGDDGDNYGDAGDDSGDDAGDDVIDDGDNYGDDAIDDGGNNDDGVSLECQNRESLVDTCLIKDQVLKDANGIPCSEGCTEEEVERANSGIYGSGGDAAGDDGNNEDGTGGDTGGSDTGGSDTGDSGGAAAGVGDGGGSDDGTGGADDGGNNGKRRLDMYDDLINDYSGEESGDGGKSESDDESDDYSGEESGNYDCVGELLYGCSYEGQVFEDNDEITCICTQANVDKANTAINSAFENGEERRLEATPESNSQNTTSAPGTSVADSLEADVLQDMKNALQSSNDTLDSIDIENNIDDTVDDYFLNDDLDDFADDDFDDFDDFGGESFSGADGFDIMGNPAETNINDDTLGEENANDSTFDGENAGDIAIDEGNADDNSFAESESVDNSFAESESMDNSGFAESIDGDATDATDVNENTFVDANANAISNGESPSINFSAEAESYFTNANWDDRRKLEEEVADESESDTDASESDTDASESETDASESETDASGDNHDPVPFTYGENVNLAGAFNQLAADEQKQTPAPTPANGLNAGENAIIEANGVRI